MKNLIFTFLFLFIASTIDAQSGSKPAANKEANLLSTFVNAIKPSSFSSSWLPVKSQWLDKALKSGGAINLAKNITSLAGFIKPSMFKSGFNLKNLQKTANSVKTMADAAGLFKSLESGIKPEGMTDSWKDQRTGWLSELEQLK